MIPGSGRRIRGIRTTTTGRAPGRPELRRTRGPRSGSRTSVELDRVASPVGPSLSVLLEASDHVLQLAQRHLAVALGEGHVGEERLVGKGLVAGGHALEVEVRRVDLVEG